MKDTMQRLTAMLHGVIIAAHYRVGDSGLGIDYQARWRTFEVMAREEGFTMLGMGHFAAAFSHPELDGYAIKVGFKKDDSGAAYAAYCRAHQGETGIPNIHLIKRFSRAYMVVMDKYRSLNDIGVEYCLEEDTYEQKYLSKSWSVSNYIINRGCTRQTAFDYVMQDHGLSHVELQYVRQLAKTCESIHSYFRDIAQFDLHSDNVMVDVKGNLIITDPVSWTTEDNDDNLNRLNEVCE